MHMHFFFKNTYGKCSRNVTATKCWRNLLLITQYFPGDSWLPAGSKRSLRLPKPSCPRVLWSPVNASGVLSFPPNSLLPRSGQHLLRWGRRQGLWAACSPFMPCSVLVGKFAHRWGVHSAAVWHRLSDQTQLWCTSGDEAKPGRVRAEKAFGIKLTAGGRVVP